MRFTIGTAVVALAAGSLIGCGPTVFQGKTNVGIAGELPPPPPPPPPPPKPKPKPKVRAKIVKSKIVISEKVQFELNKANILEASHALLNDVAKVMKDNAQVMKVRVEGHASSDGPDAHNMALSKRRAKAVMAFLVAAGVDAGRLESEGYGETKPIASNDDDEGRIKNRRVEFNILEQSK